MSDNPNTVWLKNRIDDLFCETKEAWFVNMILEVMEDHKEQLESEISDARCKMLVLMEYTPDVFLFCRNGRLGFKVYDKMQALYQCAQTLFNESVIPVALESIVSLGLDYFYKGIVNLFKLILFDEDTKHLIEKLTVLFSILDESYILERRFMNEEVPYHIFFETFAEDIKILASEDYKKQLMILRRIRNCGTDYMQYWDRILWKCQIGNAASDKREELEKREFIIREKHDKEACGFLETYIKDFEEKNSLYDCTPFWIFGSDRYRQMLSYMQKKVMQNEKIILYANYENYKKWESIFAEEDTYGDILLLKRGRTRKYMQG